MKHRARQRGQYLQRSHRSEAVSLTNRKTIFVPKRLQTFLTIAWFDDGVTLILGYTDRVAFQTHGTTTSEQCEPELRKLCSLRKHCAGGEHDMTNCKHECVPLVIIHHVLKVA